MTKTTILSLSLLLVSIYFFALVLHGFKTENTLTIGFTGDVMIGRTVNTLLNKKDSSYIWGNILPLLKSNDLNIINLETTLTNSAHKVPKVFNFKATPDKVQALSFGNLLVANLANNHILDFNVSGLSETIQTLDKANILHVGAGMNEKEARTPVIINKNGTKIGIIGYTDNEPNWESIGNKPGTNYVKVGNIDKIKQDINDLRSKVDIIVFSIHWGPNMRQKPTQEFIDFAHTIIDLGIDIFHGHSAHVFQGIEIYKNKLIMYDTGDFIDDYAINPDLRNNQSFLFCVTIANKKLVSVKLVPTIIAQMQVNKASGKEAQEILEKMKRLSSEFNTKITDSGYIYI